MTLQRTLGLSAVLAIVVGDMIGSGVFFTPGELAAVATNEWQVYCFWLLCGAITLCGALTLAELAVLLPRPGVAYHALTEAYGPFAGFMQAWIMVLVSGPGAIAGIAILFGEFANNLYGAEGAASQTYWAIAAILALMLINLAGAQWGGRTQVALTTVKLAGLAALIAGGIFFAPAADTASSVVTEEVRGDGLFGVLRLIGLGVAIVLFTYDGWIDASNVAGEVKEPGKNFPLAMGVGVVLITGVYLAVNYAFLSVMSLEEMRAAPSAVPDIVARAAFGSLGGSALSVLITVSIFGALGGLIMTLPRLYYAAAVEYLPRARQTRLRPVFNLLAWLSPGTAVPAGAIVFAAGISIATLFFFGSFSRIVTFFLVPFQFMNILMVSSIFRLRPRLSSAGKWRMPWYPVLPVIFIAVMLMFLVAAVVFNPLDSLIGVGLTLLGLPVYRALDAARTENR